MSGEHSINVSKSMCWEVPFVIGWPVREGIFKEMILGLSPEGAHQVSIQGAGRGEPQGTKMGTKALIWRSLGGKHRGR